MMPNTPTTIHDTSDTSYELVFELRPSFLHTCIRGRKTDGEAMWGYVYRIIDSARRLGRSCVMIELHASTLLADKDVALTIDYLSRHDTSKLKIAVVDGQIYMRE